MLFISTQSHPPNWIQPQFLELPAHWLLSQLCVTLSKIMLLIKQQHFHKLLKAIR